MASMVEGLRHLGASRPLVATAFQEATNELIARYLAEAELEVVAVKGLSVRSPAEASRVEAHAYYELAHNLALAHPEADSVFLGTRGNTREIAMRLAEDLALPVVYSTQAALWWALRQLRVSPLPGCGGLLEG